MPVPSSIINLLEALEFNALMSAVNEAFVESVDPLAGERERTASMERYTKAVGLFVAWIQNFKARAETAEAQVAQLRKELAARSEPAPVKAAEPEAAKSAEAALKSPRDELRELLAGDMPDFLRDLLNDPNVDVQFVKLT